MPTDRTAAVTWRGSLLEGEGTITEVGTGSFGPLEVTWAARTEDQRAGATSPEELIAAAHASCYSMALSHALAQAGTPADQLDTTATVTFQPGDGIIRVALTVAGTVPGIDATTFGEHAQGAKAGCPVSKALAGVPEITVDATLQG